MSSIFEHRRRKTDFDGESAIDEERRQQPFKTSVEVAMQLYFRKLDGQPSNLFKVVMGEAEFGLLKSTMDYARGNQSKASEYLGINRGTLRKKLKEHGLEK